MKVKTLIMTGYGINCDYETQHAFQLAGSEAERIHLIDLIKKKVLMDDYHILAIPGGFSFGDDIASARVLSNKIKYNLSKEIHKFIEDKKLIIGICNGFQSLVKIGLLPGFDRNYNYQTVTLTFNDSGRFEDRWVYLKANPKAKCVFTMGIESMYLPIRHGEGKFITKNASILKKLHENNHVVFQYTDDRGNLAGYPYNPNGSLDNIAGICDETGRIFGLMPHPEAFTHFTNHPRWTRMKNIEEEGEGLQVFRNAVEYIEENFS